MNSLLILLAMVGAALAAPSGQSSPTTLADCVARAEAGPSDEMKAKFAGFKTCAKACFEGSGVAFSAQDKSAMTCFKTAKEDNMAFFKQSSEIQAAKTAFLACASKTCSATPLPKPAGEAEHTSKQHGAMTYDPANPRDKHMCAMGLLMRAAKAAGASRPQFSADQKTALHTCMEKCHPDHPQHAAEAHASQSNHHRRGRKHHSCLGHFCTKANFETCKPNFEAAKPAAAAHFKAEFANTCSCLQKIGGTVDCSGPSDATCSAVFEEMHKMFQAKHTSST